jgi:hypothetical protein
MELERLVSERIYSFVILRALFPIHRKTKNLRSSSDLQKTSNKKRKQALSTSDVAKDAKIYCVNVEEKAKEELIEIADSNIDKSDKIGVEKATQVQQNENNQVWV